MQISRLFEIVYILMNKKVTTAKELSEHFEVSQRTIYRDIETLCQAGIPIYTSKGKGGGIGLMDQFVLNKSILSEQEQSDILSALQGLKAANYNETDQVLSKLNSLFGNKLEDWIEVDFSNWNSSDEDKKKFGQLKEAILCHKRIEFDYFNSYGQETHRIIEPQKLVFKGQAWYLYGFCKEKEDIRYFKITRIKALRILEETFVPTVLDRPKEERSHIDHFTTIQLILKIDSEMAFRIYDEFPKEAIKRKEDGSFLITTTVTKTGNWLSGYLMSYEDHIEIIEPVDLREQLITKYKNSLSKYKYDI